VQQGLGRGGEELPGVASFGGSAPLFEQDNLRQDVERELGADEHRHANLAGAACGLVESREGLHALLLAHEVGAVTIVDAVHYAAHKVIDVKEIDTDFLMTSAYKFFGPHMGVMYAKAEALQKVRTLRVLSDDNAMPPEKIETGTPNFEHICGCAAAIDFIADIGQKHEEFFQDELKGLSGKRKDIVAGMLAIDAYEEPMAKKLRTELGKIEGLKLYTSPEGLPKTSTVSFTIAGKNSHDIAVFLASRGIFVWDGNFYAIEITDHVLNLKEQGGLLRIGLAPYTIAEEIDRTIIAVQDFCKL
jgi:selenocysteine lyase/cysteine desulfurase